MTAYIESPWVRHEGVTVVECPSCGFCFDADHEDMGGGYSCPACVEIKLRDGGISIRFRALARPSWHADGAPILAEEKQTRFPGSKPEAE